MEELAAESPLRARPTPELLACFAEGTLAAAAPHGSGHIHDTFRVHYRAPSGPQSLVLQRINLDVFPDPEALMANILRVSSHLRAKRSLHGVEDLHRRVLTVVETRAGAPFHREPSGAAWRALRYVERARPCGAWDALDRIAEAARAFGLFLAELADLPGPPLLALLPRFHDGRDRWRIFQETLGIDPLNRAGGCAEEIAFAENQAELFDTLPRLLAAGKLPLRPTHNDTKSDNVLLDADSGQALCVIDLDTTMPGVAPYDFGDLVRTTVSKSAEDETELARIVVDLERFEALAQGYLEGAGASLTASERDHLALGCVTMALIVGLRFLTDHLGGDCYFKINGPDHNLQRARAQFRLARALHEREEAMARIIAGVRPQ